MAILILGATGATGRLLVKELLHRNQGVKVIVRDSNKLPKELHGHDNLEIIKRSIYDLSEAEIAQHINNCEAVASCLGHNLTFKGIFGHPRKLVTDVTGRFCNAINEDSSSKTKKFVLMNTAGNQNRELNEKVSFAQTLVLMLLRLLLPPHVDNEQAAKYLWTEVGQQSEKIEWSVVRPDTLIDEKVQSPYEISPSPTRSAIFNPGKTSRINVAHFMADLITDTMLWEKWKGQMPVIYNRSD